MALKPAARVKVDTTGETYDVIVISAKTVDGRKESIQKVDANTGIPLWVLDALRTDADGEKSTVSVTVPLQVEPKINGPAIFVNLQAGTWVSGEKIATGGMFFHADEVRPASSSTPQPVPQSARPSATTAV